MGVMFDLFCFVWNIVFFVALLLLTIAIAAQSCYLHCRIFLGSWKNQILRSQFLFQIEMHTDGMFASSPFINAIKAGGPETQELKWQRPCMALSGNTVGTCIRMRQMVVETRHIPHNGQRLRPQ